MWADSRKEFDSEPRGTEQTDTHGLILVVVLVKPVTARHNQHPFEQHDDLTRPLHMLSIGNLDVCEVYPDDAISGRQPADSLTSSTKQIAPVTVHSIENFHTLKCLKSRKTETLFVFS